MPRLDEIHDYRDRVWRVNDRVRCYPFGEGTIAGFVSAGLAIVEFHNGLRETVSTGPLTLVRRRRADEVPYYPEPDERIHR